MAKAIRRTRKDFKEDLTKWLLDFQRELGKPIVVALLIKKDKIDFVSAWINTKKLEDNSEEDLEDQEPMTVIRKARKGIKPLKPSELQSDYIG